MGKYWRQWSSHHVVSFIEIMLGNECSRLPLLVFKWKNINKFFVSVPDDEKNLNLEEKRFVEDPANAGLFHDVPSPLEASQSGTKRTAEDASPARSSKKNKTETCKGGELIFVHCSDLGL